MKHELSDIELETYSRQIALSDIDYDGQLKLRNARACIIGMGGLGSLVALKLVAMGIGFLRMVDRDIVSRSDLHRQYLYDVDLVGLPKVEAAARKLGRLNPDVALEAVPESLNTMNAEEVVGGVDVVLDGLDRPEPRYILNRTCNRLNTPYVFAGAIEAFGNLTTIIPGQTVCIECIMPGVKDDEMPKCAVVGVHPAALGVVTSLQVAEAVRLMIGQEPKLANKLLYIDVRDLDFHKVEINKIESCAVCGSKPEGTAEPLGDKFFEETCARDGRRSFIISPKERTEIELARLPVILAEKGFQVKASGKLGISFKQSDHITMSILKSGTVIAQASSKLETDPKKDILETYRNILVGDLGHSETIVPEA
jgi:adenylyltransferase/sulfurtransferase